MKPMKVMTIFGTRPEAIKMAPLALELARRPGLQAVCCVTAQHRQMLDSVLEVFRCAPDYDLNIMTPRQTLSTITSKCLLSEIIDIMEGYACSSGFVSASDRQYIAVSACLKSDNTYLKYCGVLALINTINKNYPDKNITALLNRNVIKDIESLSSVCKSSYLPELNSIL